MHGQMHRNAPMAPPATTCDVDAPTVRLFSGGRHRAGTRYGEITVAELVGDPVGTRFRPVAR